MMSDEQQTTSSVHHSSFIVHHFFLPVIRDTTIGSADLRTLLIHRQMHLHRQARRRNNPRS
jgi:hypothetical protein